MKGTEMAKLVMAGLDPAIHVLVSLKQEKTWMAATKSGHDETASFFDTTIVIPGSRRTRPHQARKWAPGKLQTARSR
jgi:hypothetical protein